MNAKNIYVCSIMKTLAEMVAEVEREPEREAEREAGGKVSGKGSQAMAEVRKRYAQAKAAKAEAEAKAKAAQATVPERVEVEEGVPMQGDMHGKMNLKSMREEIERLKSENAKLKSENERLKLSLIDRNSTIDEFLAIQNSPPDTGDTTELEPELEPEREPEIGDTNRVNKPLSNNRLIRNFENAVRGYTSHGEYQFGDVLSAAKSGAKNMFGKGKTRRTYKKRSRKKRRTRRR